VWPRTRAAAWALAHATALAALAAVVAGAVGALLHGGASLASAVEAVGSLLVAFLGWIIVRFSRTYLSGEPGQSRYVAALALTLGSVHVVILAQHLGVLIAAWVVTSLGLHTLLTFYPERAAARVVAHKKFVVSRLAELAMLAAAGLLWTAYGSLSLPFLTAEMTSASPLPAAAQAAMVLVAFAVVLKSAQLPVHGWLIQVMEAPTPVSALLHAGVVNLGGVVLLKLAAPLASAPAAQTLLILAGSLTALGAGVVMMTRISIKVRLAWSTCAQMGFLLMECGLGWYDLALLHLVGHSVYKAHAFLASGEIVRASRQAQLRGGAAPEASGWRAIAAHAAAALGALAIVAGSVTAWRAIGLPLHVPVAASAIVGLGLAPLLAWDRAPGPIGLARGLVRATLGAQLYLVWHLVFAQIAGTPSTDTGLLAELWIVAVFTGLFALQSGVRAFPRGRLSSGLYPLAYAGFRLDDRVSRLVLKVWPLPTRAPSTTL
jgi:NAD(P)H-quinone oxidoreductase subunit 5